MISSSTSSDDEDGQTLKNFELFSTLHKKMPQDRIIKSVAKCLKNGAEINAINSSGETVLDIARDKNYDDLVELLSKLGCKTALDLANGRNTRLQQIIKHSVDMDTADNQKLSNRKDVAPVNLRLTLRDIGITEAQIMLKQVDEVGNTLLSESAKNGSKDVDFFIRCGININHRNIFNKSAIDLAWENKHYDIVLRLLRANSDFPKYFDLSVLSEERVQKKIKEFVESRNSFHKLIKENSLENIKDYRHSTRRSKLYLNSEGQSALYTAVENKRYEIFVFLKSAGFTFKDENEEQCVNKLPQGEKDLLKTEMISAFPQIEQGHILYLSLKSRTEKPVDKELIENLYRSLDAISEVSIILKVVQCIDYLDIVFDFDNENIEDVNLTAFEAINYKTGRICIAAKIEENKLLGTLARKLTRLAIHNLYKNDCNPFKNSDNAKKQFFANITKKIKDYIENTDVMKNSNTDDSPLITLARAFKYPKCQQQSELIVRIPHILAQYQDEGRRWLLDANTEIKSLFDYYTDQTEGGIAYRCEQFITDSFLIKPRTGIQILNEYLGEIKNIIKYEINFENPICLDSFLNSNKQVFLLKTENTLLSLINIYDSLKSRNRNYSGRDSLFLNFNSYIEKRGVINNLFYSDVAKLLCITYPYDSSKRRLSEFLTILNTLLEQKSDKKIIFVILDSKTEEFKRIKTMFNDKCHKEATDRKFTLNDLTEESQQELLEREVILQGERISLNKLIDKTDKDAKQIVDAEMLEVLINNKVIKIGNSRLDTVDLEGAYSEIADEVNMATFVDNLLSEESNDIYIISGIPGGVRENSLIEYLVNADIDDTKRTKINDLGSRVAVLNLDTTRAIKNRIQVTDDQFKKNDFKQICRNNRKRKIFWINLKHEDNVSKFMLEQIYNPDFYIRSDRFNNELVIEKSVKELLTSSTLSEIFIIGGKNKEAVARWLKLREDEERKRFERNCRNHRIMLLNSQVNMLTTFQKQVAENHGQTFHLLKFEQDQLIWCNTHGSLKMLCEYRSRVERNTKRLIGEDALITEIKDDQVVILAGDAGMGKTSSLVKLYELQYPLLSGTKGSIIKSHWLITVNLKDHLDAIRDIDLNKRTEMVEQISNFLSKVDKSITDDFARGLLRLALVKRDFGMPLLIAFDGFDEVLDEADRNNVITLLQLLKDETRAKFWITTRRHYEQVLQTTLSTFAINLDPIDNETTNEFIKKYLKNRLSLVLSREEFQSIFGNSDEVIENARMQAFTKALISKMHEVFKNDVSNLIGTPLQLYLMLEGSMRYFKEWMRDVNDRSPDFNYVGNDIWEVYENFSHRRHSIYFEKANIKEQKTQEDNLIMFDYYYRDLTKCFILHRSASKIHLERFKHIALSAGIIRSSDSNIEFVHPTFGDYFAAKVLLKWMEKWEPENPHQFMNSTKQKYFLQEILVKSDYQVIRTFINSKLLKEKIPNIHLLEEFDLEDVLFLAARESNIGIARFVLDNSSSSVNARDSNGMTVLHIAAVSGNYDMVEFLIDERYADVDARDNNGNTVLHMAAESDNLDVVKYLTDKGANVNARNVFDLPILYMTISSGNLEILKFLINEKGADFNATCSDGMTILHTAAAVGTLDIVKFLVDEKNVDFEVKDDVGMAVLQTAAMYGNFEVVKFLVNDKKADMNAKDNNGMTVLHTAASFGNLDTVKFLVDEKKVDFEVKNYEGKTVLHVALESGNLEIIKFLINEKGADFEAKDNDGKTVLNSVATVKNLDILRFLVNEQRANLNTKDNKGRTVLHAAGRNGLLDTVKFLVNEAGANLNATDYCGLTIFHMAVKSGKLSVIKFLMNQKGFDFNARSNDGKTVLHVAAGYGNLNVVKFLINEIEADYNASDICGNTILFSAIQSGNLELVKFLINEKKVILETRNFHGGTILHMAAFSGMLDVLKYLVNERRCDLNTRDNRGSTVLHAAVNFGDLNTVKFLINETGADVNAKDNCGITILHEASGSRNLELVKFLIDEKKCDLNAKSNEGMTVLHIAACVGNLDVVKFLVNEKYLDFEAKANIGKTALHFAAGSGNLDTVKFLVEEKGADLDVRDNNGTTVLHFAADSGSLSVVKYLINEKGADPNACDYNDMTVLHAAACSRRSEVVEYLINEKKADINARTNSGLSILHFAAEFGTLDVVKFLIDEKAAGFNIKNDNGLTVLHAAVTSGNLNTVKFLINETGADINAKDNDGITVLHAAAVSRNLELIKFLINERGADFDAINSMGMPVLHTAASSDNWDTVEFLVKELNANFEARDNDGWTILHMAASSGILHMIEFLIDQKGADFNASNNNGETVLHIATKFGNLDVVKFLINERNADFNTKDKSGRTILHAAADRGHLDVVKFLVNDKQLDLNTRDCGGRTVLHLACISGHLDIVKYLVDEKNADITATDENHESVLHVAIVSGKLDIVKYLVNDKQAGFETRSKRYKTVLRMAVASGDLDMVKFLIDEKGVDFNVRDKEGASVLHMAAASGNLDMVKFLIDTKGADFITRDYKGTSIMHKAARSGNLDLVKFLINEKAVDFNATDHADVTVVHEAALSGNFEILKYLINEKNAVFNVVDHNEQTLLHKAVVRGNLDMLKFLVDEKGLDFNAVEGDGFTVLHIAATRNNLEVLKFLINEKGADFNVKDNLGRTVLHAAAMADNVNVVKFLVDEKSLDCNAKDDTDITVLDLAAGHGSLECIKYMIDEGKVYFNARDNSGWNCFEVACLFGQLPVAKYLVEAKQVNLNPNFISALSSLRYKVHSNEHYHILKYLDGENFE